MKLKYLIKKIKELKPLEKSADFTVKGVSCDSKKVSPGYIFVAIKGNRNDGNKFINEAIRKGAKVVIAQAPATAIKPSAKVSFLKVEDVRKVLAKLAAEFYGNPSDKVKVIGITGTNGKTTISYLLEAVLKEAGEKAGVIGTVNYRFLSKVIPAKNTTPGPLELQELLSQMLKGGVKYLAMEVSSHALSQARVEGINFHSAIFTNLTQDHLDYHGTLDKYFQAKSILFRNLSKNAIAVINLDDPFAGKLKKVTCAKIVTYGIENRKSDFYAEGIKLGISGTEFTLVTPKGKCKIKTFLIGRHNIYNILASSAWALNSGFSLAVVKKAVEKFRNVPGRLERLSAPSKFSVFVDYAHTEDALKNVLNSLRQVSCGRIITVFGCGGERDKTKRPKMGKVVSNLADYCIITNDNPRSEDPQRIVKEILQGIKKDNYTVVMDRKKAIRKSFTLAKQGDIVLLAGKGHENYQILKSKTIHFDDREEALECLESKS